MEKRFCIECNNIIPISKNYNIKKYCSPKCQGKYRRKQPEYKLKIKFLRDKWEQKNKSRRLEYLRNWEKKNYSKRKMKNDKWKLKHPEYHKKYHYTKKAIIRETAYRKTEAYKILDKKKKRKI